MKILVFLTYSIVLYKCLTFNWDHVWKLLAGCHGELRVWEAKYFSYLFRVSQSSDYQGSFSNSASSISTKRRYLLTETLMEDVHSVIAMANSCILRRTIFRSKIWNLLTIRFLIQGSGTFFGPIIPIILWAFELNHHKRKLLFIGRGNWPSMESN